MSWQTVDQIEAFGVWNDWYWKTSRNSPDSHQKNFRVYADAVVGICERRDHCHTPAEHSWCYQRSTCHFGGYIWNLGDECVDDCECPLLVNRSEPLIDDELALRYDMGRKENRLQRKNSRPNRMKRGLRVPSQKMIWVQRQLVRQGSLEGTC
jgi:hypothetical protein